MRGALLRLTLAGWPLVRALVGFNWGVELGQAIAVAVMLPLPLSIGTLERAALVVRAAAFAVAAVGA